MNKISDLNKVNDQALDNVVGGATRTVHNDAVSYANVRHAPGLNSSVASQISNGTKVVTTGEVVYADGYNWYKIVLPGGSDEAWIAGSLIGY